jgi:hypothetical protein
MEFSLTKRKKLANDYDGEDSENGEKWFVATQNLYTGLNKKKYVCNQPF